MVSRRGFSPWSKRLVEALSAEPCVLGDLRHAFGPRDIAECKEKNIRVFGFQHRCHVLGNGFFVREIASGIEWKKLGLGF